MKKQGLSILFALSATLCFAQNDEATIKSPAEIFAGRKGAILEKRFDEAGKVGFLTVQVEHITDLSTSDKMQCIRFDIQEPNLTSGPSALLDTNEVNELINFIKYISANVITHPPVDPNTEISFTTKYNLQIGCYYQGKSGWMLFLRTTAQKPSTETDIAQEDIKGLVRLFGLAKTQMQRE